MKALFLAAIAAAGVAQAAEITIYKQPDFAGEQLTVRDTTARVSGNFTDQASSAVVRGGRWELCTQPDFKGDCVTLAPGQYGRLDSRLLHRVESMRPLDVVAYDESAYRYGRGGAIELYRMTAFRGRPFSIDRDAPQILRGEGIPVGSVVINEGRWQLCSDPGYQGYCMVLDPGEYDRFGRFNNQVTSVRRVG